MQRGGCQKQCRYRRTASGKQGYAANDAVYSMSINSTTRAPNGTYRWGRSIGNAEYKTLLRCYQNPEERCARKVKQQERARLQQLESPFLTRQKQQVVPTLSCKGQRSSRSEVAPAPDQTTPRHFRVQHKDRVPTNSAHAVAARHCLQLSIHTACPLEPDGKENKSFKKSKYSRSAPSCSFALVIT